MEFKEGDRVRRTGTSSGNDMVNGEVYVVDRAPSRHAMSVAGVHGYWDPELFELVASDEEVTEAEKVKATTEILEQSRGIVSAYETNEQGEPIYGSPLPIGTSAKLQEDDGWWDVELPEGSELWLPNSVTVDPRILSPMGLEMRVQLRRKGASS